MAGLLCILSTILAIEARVRAVLSRQLFYAVTSHPCSEVVEEIMDALVIGREST